MVKRREPTYVVASLFGRESKRSVTSPAAFRKIVSSMAALLDVPEITLKCRGYICGAKGKNEAPRQSMYVDKNLAKWTDSFAKGQFISCELFDSEWREGFHARVYGALHKMPTYSAELGRYVDGDDGEAQNCLTVAISNDLLADAADRVEAYAKEMASVVDCGYGQVERAITWDQPAFGGALRRNMIDTRFHEVPGLYSRFERRLREAVPYLCWGHILVDSQAQTGTVAAIPAQQFAVRDDLGKGRWYVRFTSDPQSNEELRRESVRYFKLLPPLPPL